MRHFKTFAAAAAATFALTATAQAAAHGEATSVCEDGWSATDVDDNGYISPIEMNAYSEAQAQQMDSDQSGTVSRDEYVNCSMAAQQAQQNIKSTERREADMEAMDTDGNGEISRSEYRDATAGSHEAAASGDAEGTDLAGRIIFLIKDAPEPDYMGMSLDEYAARSAILFSALDADGSDALTKEEFMADVPPMTDISEVINRNFDAADTDKSGDLTTTELIAANAKNADDATQAAAEDGNAADDPDDGAPVVYFRFDQPT